MKHKLTTPRDDLTNKKFGKLTVIKFFNYEEYGKNKTGSIIRRPFWECVCECGNTKIIQANALKRGQISCGCALTDYREWAKNNFKPKNIKPRGVAAFNDLFSRYVEHARRVKVKFELTKEEFKNLTKQNCHYCGETPNQVISGKNISRKGFNGGYIYNGIDRKNNELGYNKENCVPCCGICNKAKRNITYKKFKKWIHQLITYQQTKN